MEVSSHQFSKAPARSLIGAFKVARADLEATEQIEGDIGGEELTLRQTGWEIQ